MTFDQHRSFSEPTAVGLDSAVAWFWCIVEFLVWKYLF